MNERERARAFRDLRAEQAARRPRLIADTRAEILRLLAEADARVRLRLAAQPGDAERWLLADLQVEIRRMLAEFSDRAAARLAATAGAAWEAGRELIDAPLAAGGFRIDGAAPLLDGRQLVAMRAFMTDRMRDVGVAAANRINTELGLVVLGAQPAASAVTRVTEILAEASRSRAITIVRTEISRVYGVAGQARLEQAAAIVPGLKKQWRRSGKVHSRLHHDLLDGTVVDADQPFRLANGVKLMFPHDPKAPASETINCGCAALPWKADWEVATPGRKRYDEREMQANPIKRDIQEQLDAGRSVRDLLAGGKAA
jgi:hypothetical protein